MAALALDTLTSVPRVTLPPPVERRELIVRERPIVVVAVAAAATLLYLVFVLRTAFLVDHTWHFTLFDDAMISMRYAKNLADGHGLVWNVGEAPVEGYTNLLWTLAMALIHAAGVPMAKASLVASLAGIPILVLTGWTSALVARRLSGGSYAPILAMALVCFYYPAVFWTLRGTEVGAIALAITIAALVALRMLDRVTALDAVSFSVVAVVAILLRIDSLVPFLVLSVGVLAWLPSERRERVALVFAAALTLPLLLHWAFSLWYYASFWPNTYYLKMTGVSLGTRAFRGGLFSVLLVLRHLFPALVAIAAAFGPGRARWGREGLLVLGGVFLGQAIYSVYVGGDAWESYGFANRYIAVAMPLLLVFVALAVDRLSQTEAIWRASLVPLTRALCALTAAKLAIEWGLLEANRNVDYNLLFFFRDHHARLVLLLVTATTALAAGAAFAPRLVAAVSHWTDQRARRLGAEERRYRRALGLAAMVWLLMNGQALAMWAATNAADVTYDNHMARLGLLIKDSTRASATIAAARLGVLSYFSERRSIDFLGKTDPVIARMKPVGPFKPGHDRWNYQDSVERGHPDVLGDLWLPTASDFGFLASAGFVELPNHLYVRTASADVDLALIGRTVD